MARARPPLAPATAIELAHKYIIAPAIVAPMTAASELPAIRASLTRSVVRVNSTSGTTKKNVASANPQSHESNVRPSGRTTGLDCRHDVK